MTEIIASIIGAIVAGLIALIVSRKQPTYITFRQVYKGYSRGLHGLKYYYKEQLLEKVGFVRIILRNIGSKVIDNPELFIQLNPDREIISVHAEMAGGCYPDIPVAIDIEKNTAIVNPERLYPYGLDNEELVLDILAEDDIAEINISGRDILQDGTLWAVKSAASRFLYRGSIWLFSRFVQTIIIISLIVYFVLRRPWNVIKFDQALSQQLIADPYLWILIVCIFVFAIWMFILGMRGFTFVMNVPFLRRIIRARFDRYPEKNQASYR